MNLLREYIRNLLKEDPMGFVQDLSAAHQAGEFGENFMGGDVGKSGGKALKRSFAKNADHQWLSTLDTVHWTGGVEYLPALVGRGKDELSTSMTLPGENFAPPHKMGSRGVKTGLWVKGRITLAANDQDNMYTGDFVWRGMHGQMSDLSPEDQEHREKSSGINKLPSVSKDYSRYGQLKKGTEFGEKMAKNIPYVLDQSTWDPSKQHSETNEALVDNWRPIGIIVVENDVLNSVNIFGDTPSESIGVVKELFRTATEFGVPIYDVDRNEVWSPGEKEVKEESVRKYIRMLIECGEEPVMQPLMDPLFNMREMCKEFTLLEDHLNQPDMQCHDCINKHLMKCEALAEEAVSLDQQGQYPFIVEIPSVIRGWHESVLDGGSLVDLAPSVRQLRKELTPIVVDRFET